MLTQFIDAYMRHEGRWCKVFLSLVCIFHHSFLFTLKKLELLASESFRNGCSWKRLSHSQKEIYDYIGRNIMQNPRLLFSVHFAEHQDPFHWHGLTLMPAWIDNYNHYKVWQEIAYSFQQRLGAEQVTRHYLNHCSPSSLTHMCGTREDGVRCFYLLSVSSIIHFYLRLKN